MTEQPDQDIISVFRDLFGQTHPYLVPIATGLDVIRNMELRNPIRTGMKVIDLELPNGLDTGQIVEIRGRDSSGKVSFSVYFPVLRCFSRRNSY